MRLIALLISLAFSIAPSPRPLCCTECADCPPEFQFWLGEQSLRLDSHGHPHVAYVGDYVYYAWYDGAAWHREEVAGGTALSSDNFQSPPSLDLDAQDAPHIVYLDGHGTTLYYAWRTAGGWQARAIDTGTLHYLGHTDTGLHLDQDGNPQVAYINWRDLRFASWTGGEWLIEVVDDTGWAEDYVSLAVDGAGAPHISYFVWYGDHCEIKYASKTAAGWTVETVDSGEWLGEYNSIAVDGAGVPHIAYRDWTDDTVKHARRAGGGWAIETVDDAPWWKGYTSILIDQDGNPHVSYADDDSGKYAYWSGSAWSIQPFDSSAWHTSLVLDENEVPSIFYWAAWSDLSLKVTRWTGAQWEPQVVDRQPQVGRYAALALDGSGHPYISYADYGRGELKVARDQGLGWELQTVAKIGSAGGHTGLALDGSGAPHVSYYDSLSGDLGYAHWTGAAWITETVDSAGDTGAYTSLAIDGADQIHISYYDATNGDLKVAHRAGSAWITETVDAAGDVGAYTSLAVDDAGHIHVSYYDGTNGDLKAAHWTGSAWITETVDTAGDVGAYSSLALDGSGNPCISYYDGSNGDLRFARWTGAAWITETVDSAGNAGLYTSLALDAAGSPTISYYDATNANLKLAYRTGSEWITEVEDSAGDVGSYTSLALDAAGQPHIAYHDAMNGGLKYAGECRGTITLPFISSKHSVTAKPVLRDTFAGTGALTAHTPDLRPTGSFWAIKSGTFQDLLSGWARYGGDSFGNAIIDSTLVDLELSGSLIIRSDLRYGFVVRSNGDGTNRWLLHAGIWYGHSQVYLSRCPTLNSIDKSLPFTWGETPSFAADTEYAFSLKCTGSACRLWIDGVYMGSTHDDDRSYLDNTYVGLGTVDGADTMAWNSITASAMLDKRMSIFGDSISVPTSKTWPYYIEATRHGVHANHAADSARIMPSDIYRDLSEQVAAATSDSTQIALFLIGTNDLLDPGISDEYCDALVALAATNPGARLYVLGILDRNPPAWRDEKNAYIAAGVAQARGLGVDVTYWNTDGWIDPAIDTYDGLHPNAQGHAKIATEVLARLP